MIASLWHCEKWFVKNDLKDDFHFGMDTYFHMHVSRCDAFATSRDGQLHTFIYDKRDDFN